MSSPIEKLTEDYKTLTDFLLQHGELTESINVKDHYRKILLLSCASYYETRITTAIQDFVKQRSTDEKLLSFVINKALKRQYHTLFDWKQSNNINQFLGFFGEKFKTEISTEIKKDEKLKKSISAFLTIGAERNFIVHENFLEYRLEKTFEEIANLHKLAMAFIEYIEKKLLQ